MGGKTAMAAALCYPEVIEGLVVVDVSPHKVPGEGESTDLIQAMKNLDLSSLTNRREADAALKNDIKVGGIIQRNFLLYILRPLQLNTLFLSPANPTFGENFVSFEVRGQV